jgi:hypothetical protein
MNDELKMDADALWREESYTDQKVGTLRVMTPVRRDGSPDGARAVQYIGQASIYTPAGALPISFELDAASLEQACEKFPEAARKAVDETMEQLREMRRQQASQIVVPGQGGGMPGGGPGGSGGIQIP